MAEPLSGPSPRRRRKPLSPRLRRLVSAGSVAVLVVAALAVIAPTTSSAAQRARVHRTFTVRVGHEIDAGGKARAVEAMSFFPGSISVHPGDRITFAGDFHTATALPLRVKNASAWVHTHARRMGQKYFFLALDDEAETVIFNPNVGYPNCNVAKVCPYGGRHLVNSGGLGLFAPRKVTFSVNVAAGRSFWVICLIHPQMRLRVHVVPRGTPVQTQAQINAATRKRVAGLSARATTLWRKLQHQHSHVSPSGRHVVDAYAGYDVRGLELFGMFPRVVHVHPGWAVKWHFKDLRYEPHSVVFPAHLADKISQGPPPKCELDSGPGDVPANPDFTCPKGSHGPIEIELDPRVLQPSGTGFVVPGGGPHNSGARGGFDLSNDHPYTLRFPQASSARGFRYACGVHGTMMSGRVVVH